MSDDERKPRVDATPWDKDVIGVDEYRNMTPRAKARELRMQASQLKLDAAKFVDRTRALSDQPEEVRWRYERANRFELEARNLLEGARTNVW
jgi:hypothetical protein